MSAKIFGTRASLVADVNLILQVVILLILFIGALQTKRRAFSMHCKWMTAAVIANAVLIIAIMNPAFFRVLPFALRYPRASGPMILWPHLLTGALAELMGVYLVIRLKTEDFATWRSRNIKWLMRITFFLWVIALAIGIALYFVWYT